MERLWKNLLHLKQKHAYSLEDDKKNKKSNGTKKCVIKRKLMFENYKNCVLNDETILKKQHAFRSDHHNVYTVEINKIAPGSNDNKRLQTFDKITPYPYGANVF